MKFDDAKPIYRQIGDWVGNKIISGEWNEQERILSVRELAMLLQVNPNTVMRAYEDMETDGVIFNKRGIGFFVALNARETILSRERKSFLAQILPWLFDRMDVLKISKEEMLQVYDKFNSKNA